MKFLFFNVFLLFFICINPAFVLAPKQTNWGFHAHKLINKTAVFLLPQEMLAFYKNHINYLEENAVNPDARRYLVKDEAPRHFIDLDLYKEDTNDSIPIGWNDALQKYTLDSLLTKGIVPWHVYLMSINLTKAFETKDVDKILRYSTEIGHYIADANVPLHTTSNYNGQQTDQYGIHGLWESRLVELFVNEYDLFFEDASYQENIQRLVWSAVRNANLALDSVLVFEKIVTSKIGEDKKYSFEERNGITIKTYSQKFCRAYHNMLGGMVERRLRASVKMVADVWFTCWVNAGQPSLDDLLDYKLPEEIVEKNKAERLKGKRTPLIKTRLHEIIE